MSKQGLDNMSGITRIVSLLGLLAAAGTAGADQYHNQNLLIGDRASGMGGAYTAVSDDPSGLYYNPAGIVYTVGSNVSGSMNAFHTTNITYHKVLDDRLDWERKSSGLLPNFFGVYQPFGKGKVGFSYAVLDSMLEDQDQTFQQVSANVDSYTINTNNQETTYNIGPSFAMQVSDSLSIGVTLYGHMHKRQRIFNQLIFGSYGTGTPDETWSNEYDQLDEYGLRPILGLMWTPRDDLSVGLNLNQTLVATSSQNIQQNYKCAANPNPNAQPNSNCLPADIDNVIRLTSDNNVKAKYPFQTRLGIAYFPSPRLLFSGDMIYNGSTSDGKQATLNLALGGEFYLNAQWALRAGLYTNQANTPALKSGEVNQLEHVDLLGGSFSVSHFSRSSALSVGFAYASGSGKAQLFADDTRIQNVDMRTLTLFMSATYSY
jgi:long-subunit fatty acid transport protein